jgi:hypothetical protein
MKNQQENRENEKIYNQLSDLFLFLEKKGLPMKDANFLDKRIKYCRGINKINIKERI